MVDHLINIFIFVVYILSIIKMYLNENKQTSLNKTSNKNHYNIITLLPLQFDAAYFSFSSPYSSPQRLFLLAISLSTTTAITAK